MVYKRTRTQDMNAEGDTRKPKGERELQVISNRCLASHCLTCIPALNSCGWLSFPMAPTVIVPFPKTFTDMVSPSSLRYVRLYGSLRNFQRLVAVHDVSNQIIHWIVAGGPGMSQDGLTNSLYCNKQRI